MVRYKVTKNHDGLWYVFEKFSITGTGNHRWVVISKACSTRSEAYDELPAGGNAEDTLTLMT